jgi:beta-lactamase regulating signal transducer with metallopeptidase domain
METLALPVVVAAGLWLVGVAVLMALRPAYCLRLGSRMSTELERSNWRVQLIEQGLRILAGVALVLRAPASKLPPVFDVAGWLLVAVSVVILLAPIRYHGKYGTFWMERLTPSVIRALFPVPAVVGAGLIYAAI